MHSLLLRRRVQMLHLQIWSPLLGSVERMFDRMGEWLCTPLMRDVVELVADRRNVVVVEIESE